MTEPWAKRHSGARRIRDGRFRRDALWQLFRRSLVFIGAAAAAAALSGKEKWGKIAAAVAEWIGK